MPELLVATLLAIFVVAIFSDGLLPDPGGRDRARRASCISNLKQLGLAVVMYAQDYDGHYPSYRLDPRSDWGAGAWGPNDQSVPHFHSSSRWIAQLSPYIKSQWVFRCPADANPERNHSSVVVPGSQTPFPVNYGPNLMFIDPAAYGRPNRPIATASVEEPAKKYLLADCATAYGFDLDSIAYLRYPNYDPSLRQNGWSPEQYAAAGRVAWPDKQIETLTRHMLGSNIMFADGHVKCLRHDQIPNNDGRNGKQYRRLVESMAPWQPVASGD